MRYFSKMKGHSGSPPGVGLTEILWSWIGAVLGILPLSVMTRALTDTAGATFIIGSFGASAVLVYGAVRSPLAQPRNLLGGHILSALIGVAAVQLLPGHLFLAAPLAVATAIAAMHATRTLHPPGGATALIAVIGGPGIHKLGYMYALVPVGLGAAIMLIVALFVNNLSRNRRYPEFWL
ncbi:HPP family protein [Desulfatiferula olefinivorans]